MSQPETRLQVRIVKALNALPQAFFQRTRLQGASGWPDITGSFRGLFVAFEVKLPGREGNVSPAQGRAMHRIRQSGGEACVVSSPEQALDFVERLNGSWEALGRLRSFAAGKDDSEVGG